MEFRRKKILFQMPLELACINGEKISLTRVVLVILLF